MRKEKLILSFIIVSLIAMAFRVEKSPGSFIRSSISAGDTSSFIPNKGSGWDIISSYLNQDTPDSVDLELILRHNSSVTWSTDQFIGTITNKTFIPSSDQKSNYDLYRGNTWTIRVTASGQCFLSQLTGEFLKVSSLSGSPYVVPVKVRYKNN